MVTLEMSSPEHIEEPERLGAPGKATGPNGLRLWLEKMMRKVQKRGRLGQILTMLALAAVLVGCAPAASPAAVKATGTPIKLGFISVFSGPLASFGWVERIAVNLAKDDVNAAGGINGSPLQLVQDDSPFDPKQAVTLVRKQAEQDGVFAIVGPVASGELEVVAPLANELKIPVASPSATKVGIAAANRPYSFQLNVPDDMAEPPVIDALKKLYPNVKKVLVLGDTKDAVTQYMVKDIFPRLLKEKGLEVVDTVSFDTGTTDFSAVVTKVKAANPDAIALAGLLAEASLVAKELQRQGVKVPVITSNHCTGGPIVEIGGDAVEGWIMPGSLDPESSDPKLRAFVKRFYEQAQADPNVKVKPQHLNSEPVWYDTVTIMADIMRKAGIKPTTPVQEARQKIMEGMNSLKDYQGVSTKLTMQTTGAAAWAPTPPMIAQKGKYVTYR